MVPHHLTLPAPAPAPIPPRPGQARPTNGGPFRIPRFALCPGPEGDQNLQRSALANACQPYSVHFSGPELGLITTTISRPRVRYYIHTYWYRTGRYLRTVPPDCSPRSLHRGLVLPLPHGMYSTVANPSSPRRANRASFALSGFRTPAFSYAGRGGAGHVQSRLPRSGLPYLRKLCTVRGR